MALKNNRRNTPRVGERTSNDRADAEDTQNEGKSKLHKGEVGFFLLPARYLTNFTLRDASVGMEYVTLHTLLL